MSNTTSNSTNQTHNHTHNQTIVITPPSGFAKDLSCYECISRDFIYCVKGKEYKTVFAGLPGPDGICCQNKSSCPQTNDPKWTCSSFYNDKALSYKVCPFSVKSCGA